jgi:hypothetical protein
MRSFIGEYEQGPSDRMLGNTREAAIFGEIVSCILWAFVMASWVVIVNRPKACKVMPVAFVLTGSIIVLANLLEVVSKAFWQKSCLWLTISFAEVIGSSLVLAVGCDGSYGQSNATSV